jgi:hypothetical protein
MDGGTNSTNSTGEADSNNNNNGTDKVSISALVIALIALLATLVQLAQTIIASAKGLPNCDKRVMGRWAKHTKRKFRPTQLRLEVQFEAPVIFLARKDNPNGPIPDVPIWYAEGTKKSCDDTRTVEPQTDDHHGFSNGSDANVDLGRERVSTVDNELATWVTLLGAIQKMEKDSKEWEAKEWRTKHNHARPNLEEPPTLAVGIQAIKRSFDANPAVKKPFATTTICHIVELAAILGLYWKVFNRDENKYHAEGNGFSLLGTRVTDFGIVFVFEKPGWPRFRETRVIPTSEVKELCFGNVPTFFRPKTPHEEKHWQTPFHDQKTLKTLQLGSRKEIRETLNLIGCSESTSLYFAEADEEAKHSHLFPGTSKILSYTVAADNVCSNI